MKHGKWKKMKGGIRYREWFKVTEPGELKRFGWSSKKSTASRRAALSKAVKSPRNSGLEVYHKLWGIANVTKTNLPKYSKIYRNDALWVKKAFYGTKFW